MSKKNSAPIILLPHFFMADDPESVREEKVLAQDKIFQNFLLNHYDIDNSDQVFHSKFISFSPEGLPSLEPGELVAQASERKDTIVFQKSPSHFETLYYEQTLEIILRMKNNFVLIDASGEIIQEVNDGKIKLVF
jgi:hypothetical protein